MVRTPLVVANWKMNKTIGESLNFVEVFLPLVSDVTGADMAVAPGFISLMAVSKAIRGSRVALAAQNMHWEMEGAYTGEVSPEMLMDTLCRYVILGHSERRQFFGEGDGEVSRKVLAALSEGIVPILCVGETLGERDYGRTFEKVEGQLRGSLEGVALESGEDLVLAYEPVWAIGTGKTATPEEAQEVHAFARECMVDLYGAQIADPIRILYGGSVKPDNAGALMSMADIDGALVGGASLDPESFARIIKAVIRDS